MSMIKGKIVHVEVNDKVGKGYTYQIKGEDGVLYFAHVGDLFENEEIVYNHPGRVDLSEHDVVEFQPYPDKGVEPKPRAFHVKKIA